MLLKKKTECLVCFKDADKRLCFYNLFSNKTLCCSCFEQIEYKPRIINYKDHKIIILYQYNTVLRQIIKQWKINKCVDSQNIIAQLVKEYLPKNKTIIYPPSFLKNNEKTNLEKLLNSLNLTNQNIFLKNTDYELKTINPNERKSNFSLKNEIPNNFYLIDDVYASGSTIENAINILENFGHHRLNILIIASTKQ